MHVHEAGRHGQHTLALQSIAAHCSASATLHTQLLSAHENTACNMDRPPMGLYKRATLESYGHADALWGARHTLQSVPLSPFEIHRPSRDTTAAMQRCMLKTPLHLTLCVCSPAQSSMVTW